MDSIPLCVACGKEIGRTYLCPSCREYRQQYLDAIHKLDAMLTPAEEAALHAPPPRHRYFIRNRTGEWYEAPPGTYRAIVRVLAKMDRRGKLADYDGAAYMRVEAA